MTRLDIELSNRNIDVLRQLARDHHGDDSETSIDKVMETALALRLIWLSLAGDPTA